MKYELFCLDEEDNIVRSEKFEANNDVEAFESARLHCKDHSVELWAEDHRVSAFRPSAHAPACSWPGALNPMQR